MPWFSFIILTVALVGLWFGTNLAVKNAVKIAKNFGLSEFFIGLTIISIGTDLPEMVVSITGAIHKLGGEETSGIIIGSAIGRCLGQIGLALGLSGLFYRVTINRADGIRDEVVYCGFNPRRRTGKKSEKIQWGDPDSAQKCGWNNLAAFDRAFHRNGKL
ncbi:MAG: hypothetical protein KGM98_09915 [Bacteroidota bacterium]|nr:hypothetical protein [Bacteroidota bacterium]